MPRYFFGLEGSPLAFNKNSIIFGNQEGHALTSGDGACPACARADCACYEAGIEGFRVWCPTCDHSTAHHPDLDLARLEWHVGREAT